MDSKKQASTPLLNWFFRSLALFIPPPQLHALHDDNHRPDDGGGAVPVAVRPMVVLVVVVDSVQPASFISAWHAASPSAAFGRVHCRHSA